MDRIDHNVIHATQISPGYVRPSLPTAWRRTPRQLIRTGMREFGPDPVAVARAVCFAVE